MNSIPESMLLRIVLFCAAVTVACANDVKKPEADSEAPILSSLQPLAITIGVTNKITLRGKNLGELKTLRLAGCSAPIAWKLVSKAESKSEKQNEKSKTSPDQQLEAEFKLPDDAPLGTNVSFVAANLKGESKPLPVFVAAAGTLIEEKEPNDGFKEAQPVDSGVSISGALGQATDVDVFKVAAKAGQKFRFEVIAARLGSLLDGSLTIYNAKGTILASNDDAAGRDPILAQTIPADGDYFIALSSVGEIPAKTSAPYILKVSVEP